MITCSLFTLFIATRLILLTCLAKEYSFKNATGPIGSGSGSLSINWRKRLRTIWTNRANNRFSNRADRIRNTWTRYYDNYTITKNNYRKFHRIPWDIMTKLTLGNVLVKQLTHILDYADFGCWVISVKT